MASNKNASEGISLLSMYGDDDMDVEDDEETEEMEGEADEEKSTTVTKVKVSESILESTPVSQSNTPGMDGDLSWKSPYQVTTPLTEMSNSPLPSLAPPPVRKSQLAIVDYAHDETAMSPEAEDGEIVIADVDMLTLDIQHNNGALAMYHCIGSHKNSEIMCACDSYGLRAATLQKDDLQEKSPVDLLNLTSNVQATPPFLEPSDLFETGTSVIYAEKEQEDAQNAILTRTEEVKNENLDPLEKFLPPPPKTKCSDELQEKINKFLALRKAGKSFNRALRNRKDYRNPDFLQHAVRYQDIDQIGTCFSKDVFDPHGYDKSDYYDEIEADMKREKDRRENEKKKNQKIEFTQGGTQPAMVIPSQKLNTPVAGISAISTTGPPQISVVLESRESRHNKKTKWDKVDGGDRRNIVQPMVKDSMSTVSAHAALLSSANAGAGYMAFAQQKRREAEEKKSSERKLERRS